ncbi:MAG: hypothetical protein WC992_03145 [Acholeplasmataceae bacterium]
MAAAVASVLELSLSEVPHFVAHDGDDWWDRLQMWLRPRGLCLLQFDVSEAWPDMASLGDDIPCLVGGISPRGLSHCVVGRWRQSAEKAWVEYWHDPHPSGAFLTSVQDVSFFVGVTLASKDGGRYDEATEARRLVGESQDP